MLAFTLIRALGPDHWGAGPRHRVRRAEKSAQTAIAPSARSPGHGVLHRQRTAPLLERDATAIMHVNLTVEVSAAASELLASRLVPQPSGQKPCGLNDLGGPGCRSDGRSSPPAVKCGVSIDASR